MNTAIPENAIEAYERCVFYCNLLYWSRILTYFVPADKASRCYSFMKMNPEDAKEAVRGVP